MSHLIPFTIGDTLFRDMRGPMTDEETTDIYQTTHRIREHVMDVHYDVTGVDPGCATRRNSVDGREYAKLIKEQKFEDYQKYTKKKKNERQSRENYTDVQFMLGGFVAGKSIGSIEVFGIKFAPYAPTLNYTAYCAPFLDAADKTAELMRYMLEHSLDAISDDDSSFVTQLTEWAFPVIEKRNRWDQDFKTTKATMDALLDLDIEFRIEDGQRFPTRVRLPRPRFEGRRV